MLQKIVTRVGQINGMVSDIARQTESQSVNLEQVNTAVAEMDRMTQHNAAMVEESTAAARSLAEEANTLTGLVKQFRISGSKSAMTRAIPAPAAARRPAAKAPVSHGNLALKSEPVVEEDWTEF